jgi:Holliday junction resolvasome RuvABC endonuclease subunit
VRILALDIATTTGWAYWVGSRTKGTLIRSGFTKVQLRRGDSRGTLFLKWEAWLRSVLKDARPHVIAYEEPAYFKSMSAGEVVGGLIAIMSKEAAKRNISVMSVHLSTLKKHATGHGQAPKVVMQRAAMWKWGSPIKDDNQGDALCVLDWALEELGLHRPVPGKHVPGFIITKRLRRGKT